MTINPIAARFAGRPLAIAPRALEALLSAPPLSPARQAAFQISGAASGSTRGYLVADGGIAVVPIIGPLLSRGDWVTELFGIMSYADLMGAIESAFADPAANGVLFELDSPGGEVGGLFDLVEQIATLKAQSGKPLWAVASECALSATYAIGSAADRLYVTQTGEAGSIGVVAAHVDESAADAMAGQKWTLIQAGAKKTDGNPHQPLSSQAFASIQVDVDALYADFVDLVAENRGVTPEAIRATDAGIYRGQRALAVGLADGIGTVSQALADFGSELGKTRTTAARSNRAFSSEPRSPVMTNTERPASAPATEHGAAPTAPPAPTSGPVPIPAGPVAPAAPSAPVAPAGAHSEADVLRAEYSEIASIAGQAGRLGVTIDAADAMKKGVKPEGLRRSVLDALAARTEASTIVAAAPVQAATGMSPIVRRARERAAAGKN